MRVGRIERPNLVHRCEVNARGVRSCRQQSSAPNAPFPVCHFSDIRSDLVRTLDCRVSPLLLDATQWLWQRLCGRMLSWARRSRQVKGRFLVISDELTMIAFVFFSHRRDRGLCEPAFS